MKAEIVSRDGKIVRYTLPLEIFKEGKVYVAHCSALRLASHGRTRQGAERAFQEAAALFFEELQRLGTLKDVLRECGWERAPASTPKTAYTVPPQIWRSEITIKPVSKPR